MKSRSLGKVVVFLTGIITVGVILLFAYYHFTGRGGGIEYGKGKSKDELLREYIHYKDAGEKFKAYQAIKAVSDREQDNISLLLKAAEAAIDAGKKAAANEMLQKVWANGYRDPKVLFSLVTTSILPKYEQRKQALKLISEINEESLREKLYALYYFQLEQYEDAQSHFQWLVENDPHQVVYEYYARNYLYLRRVAEAKEVLQEALASGFLGPGGEIILANLLAVQGALLEEEKLYQDFNATYGQSDFVMLSQAIILVANKKFTEAEEIFEFIDNPYRFSAKNIESADEIIREFNSNPELKGLFDRLGEKTRKIINSDKLDIFEKALFLDYISNDFNRIATENITSESTFSEEADKLQDLFDSYITDLGGNYIAHQARIYLSYLYFHNKDEEGINKLRHYAEGNLRIYEGERALYAYYQAELKQQKNTYELLKKAERILGRNVVAALSAAEYMSRTGNYNEAIRLYSKAAKINKTVGSGVYLLENLARALADDKKYLASFELIRMMHERRLITRETLSLLRDVSYPAGFPEISAGAQRVLEKKFGKSDEILLGGGELKLKEGDAQAALEVFEKLLAKGVEPTYQARLDNAVAESMLQLQMFENVLDIVEEKEISESYRGSALYGMGDYEKAFDVFSRLNEEAARKGQWRVEYALLLALKNREKEAAEQFHLAIQENPKLIRPYVELASLLLKHKQFGAAREYALDALKLADSLIRAKLIVANVDIVQERNASATVILEDILREYPDNIDALFLLSRSLFNQNENAEALKVIERCLLMQPKQPLFLQHKIDILVSQDRLKEALKVCDYAIGHIAENSSFEHAKVMLLLELDEFSKAADALKESINIQSDNRLILESQIYEAEGKYSAAFKALQPYKDVPKVAL